VTGADADPRRERWLGDRFGARAEASWDEETGANRAVRVDVRWLDRIVAVAFAELLPRAN
jgi:hypothetical protein